MHNLNAHLHDDYDSADEAITEATNQLIDSGVNPLFVAGAAFHQGVVRVAVRHLDTEQKLILCQSLQNFINDTRLAIHEQRD